MHSRTGTDLSFRQGTTQRKVISWEENDKENPHNWSTVRQSCSHAARTYTQMS